MSRPQTRQHHAKPQRTLAEKRAAFLQLLVMCRTLDGAWLEIAERTCGLPEREIAAMVAAERERRGAHG